MRVSCSGSYAWHQRPAQWIDSLTFHLHHRLKSFFDESRGSLGRRRLVVLLHQEGFSVGCFGIHRLMKTLQLAVKQRRADRE